jgi:DNA-binding NarL/FixJ family response regulator
MKSTIGIIDDQKLFAGSLRALIEEHEEFEVIVEEYTGVAFLERLKGLPSPPDVILVDVQMEPMDGPTVAAAVRSAYPGAKMVALTMKDDDESILKMIRAGCTGYLSKDMHAKEFKQALSEVHRTGFYNADLITKRSRRLLRTTATQPETVKLTDREKEFLQFACSDHSYKEIASKMFLSYARIDDFRKQLFMKFEVKSRTGMVLEGVRKKLIKFDY